jgi:hypothetical protein
MKTKISEQRLNYLDKDLLFTIHNELLRVGNYELEWVPSHVGIEGNEKADQKAKQALSHKTVKFIPTRKHDTFTINYANDQPRGSPSDFVSDIVDSRYRKYNMDMYEITATLNHPLSKVPDTFPTNKQIFHARAKTNTLATRSKMEKWFNQNSVCPRCFTEHEDQKHLFVECTENKPYEQRIINNFIKIVQTEQHQGQVANKDVRIPGTDIYYNQYQTFKMDKYKHNDKIYKERLGLISIKYADKIIARTHPRKPNRLIQNITTMLLDTAQEIWYDRCTANAAIPEDALGVGLKSQ